MPNKDVLVAKNDSEPIQFTDVADMLAWLSAKDVSIKDLTDFFNGGYILDSAGNRYSLSDLEC